ncbi:histidinol dehydrogenase [Corallincola spongiicola]|uniref:Histidinol dehydrogenase n=1 Tax=Corallincola spongiicola TaxID=2520508 RepID=A0ABY1WVB8_9GAMM|nr:histidinol dehydrogenase [Corallincola spongiicola]TAA48617.1 histidinol dehydrogenase [Corallincola spongiicola]
MRTVYWDQLSTRDQTEALSRPAINAGDQIRDAVEQVLSKVRRHGDQALKQLTENFDGVKLDSIKVSAAEINAAAEQVDESLKQAIQQACDNIHAFHEAQRPTALDVETQPGVRCEMVSRPIESVGLYIPGGTAPLVSTVMMLAIPAKIAGCVRTVLVSPPSIAPEILYAAKLCGVDEVYSLGGAQAIAALAYGTESIAKVDKIFGPGNSYVTEAKRQVSQNHDGAAIDMPAGPSEVLVIADEEANPDFVAADLLSQAEHGADSQVVLVTPCDAMAAAVSAAVQQQLAELSREDTAAKAIANSVIIICHDLTQAVAISNQYGPEHLIIQTREPRALLNDIQHAGSVFLGDWSPESVGDYASGTNHVLPTYGYVRTYSSLSLSDFSKRFTVQELTADGLSQLAPCVTRIADAEGLDAHKRAVTIRTEFLEGLS